MKNSGVEWIGEIPDDWEVKRGKELFFEINDRCKNPENYPLLSVSEYYGVAPKSEKIDEGDFITHAETLDGYKICQKGDIVQNIMLAWKRATGMSNYEGLISPAYCIYRPYKGIDSKYYHYLFRTDVYADLFKQYSTGIIDSRLRLYPAKFLSLKYAYPPKSTQQRIATYLDKKCSKIEETIQNQQQVIEKLKAYKQSLITEAVTGKKYHENCHTDSILLTQNSNEDMKTEIPLGISNPCGSIEFKYCNLSFIADFKNGLNYNASDFGTEVKFLGVGDFQNYLVLNDESMFSNIITDTEIEDDYYLKNGDIIFVRSNGSKELVGRAIMVDNIDFKVTYSGFCIRLRNKEPKKINSKFLLYFFRSDYFRNELQRLSQGSNIANINQDLLSHIKIPLVDIRFQESVVDFLNKKCTAIDTAIEQKQKLIEKLTEFKKSLIYECVTGKKEI